MSALPGPGEHAAGEPDSLFAYGTLRFAPVLDRLLGRCPATTPVTLPGWRAARLPGRVYPGLVRAPGGCAPGVLLTGLSVAERALLDAYEGDEYRLDTVEFGNARAWVYIWTGAAEDADWSAEEFAARHLADYLARWE
ncbi:gamma-glutamylcyclotransferase family protein [Nocardia farcinica]|uniref:Putative gamma-glutamylcyclotransferase n=1 Tax=Nocardia farcinica (strain IFM 10152) TaxID=247156 RepID=Q5YT56_NOCFA|nr:gamma-glutamylcyclotransferase family protein [Nocardia farcinica]BAD58635.1 hypothetical protein NFA_37870 [Nocardia farcinica IFM 10152]